MHIRLLFRLLFFLFLDEINGNVRLAGQQWGANNNQYNDTQRNGTQHNYKTDKQLNILPQQAQYADYLYTESEYVECSYA
jgi:hypothetical protein